VARRPQSTPPVLPGFTYVRPLGAGGFADVFLYEQDMPRRVVAVKVLTADALNSDARQQFNSEADVMARLSAHPSILTIFQASISSDGRPYLVTEFCPESMGDRYKQAPLPLATVLDVGVRMAGALETAHRSGVLHRDIKPSNILVSSLGQPVLADFGIAAAMQAAADEDQFVAMSVPWSSPEIVTEATTGTVHSEVWSLGATLYTFLAGRSPFAAPEREKNTRDLVKQRVARARYSPIHRPDVPPAVEQLLSRTMAREPVGRPQSMLAFGEEVRWLQAELGLPQTQLDVVSAAWAAPVYSGAPVSDRGPVITTVSPGSRRARRANRFGAHDTPGTPPAPGTPRSPAHPDDLIDSSTSSSRGLVGWRAGLVGGAIGAVLVAAIVAVLLITRVIGV
jgi:serine/threonine protein kinase